MRSAKIILCITYKLNNFYLGYLLKLIIAPKFRTSKYNCAGQFIKTKYSSSYIHLPQSAIKRPQTLHPKYYVPQYFGLSSCARARSYAPLI